VIEAIVDGFAGGGGASLGIEWALGRSPDLAINHDPEAIAMHMANHPKTRHLITDITKVNPIEEVRGQAVGLAWFSPDCKHFSKAKGARPVSKKIRDLAWVVIRWAREVQPRIIMLENVEEFTTWGPLLENGKPDPARKGETFNRWLAALRACGYNIEFEQLRACDYGAPTIRRRLFLIARRDGERIVWPEATHGPGRALPWRTAAECIDWAIPCHSIFLSREEGRKLGVNRPLVDATMARIARGIDRYVINAAEPFIVPVTHSGDLRSHPVSEQFRTITAAHRGEHALVAPYLVPRYGEREGQEPRVMPATGLMPTVVPTGNGASLVTAFLAQHNLGMVGHDARKPVSTITQRGTQQQVVAAHLINLKGSDRRSGPADAPGPTICAGGWHVGEVRAFLMKYHRDGGQLQPLTDPAHTLDTRGRLGLVMVYGEPYMIVDIGMRMFSRRELFRAQGFPDSYIIDPVYNGKPLTNTASIRMCGNSVSPVMSKALVAANYDAEMRNAA
jgi:DNA (cytosine-5)-methyltransferase 1